MTDTTTTTTIELRADVEALASAVRIEGAATMAEWKRWIERKEFRPSAENLAQYLALRRRDIRPLQRRLMARGLSSLGRLESRVLPSFDAVLAVLDVLVGSEKRRLAPDEATFFAGENRLVERTVEILGPGSPNRAVHLLVTCPSEAAEGPDFMRRLAEAGVEAVRINCAHDDADAWARMIDYAKAAGEMTGRSLKVLMDLAGPKIRTGAIRDSALGRRVHAGGAFALVLPGMLGSSDPALSAVECTLVEGLKAARPGERIFLDDGKLATVVEAAMPWGLTLRVALAPDDEGYKLKEEKGVNFPDTEFSIPALTAKDREDLAFIAAHADGVEFSFVQSEADVAALQDVLAALRPDWQKLALVLKIETTRALANLPEMLVRAAGRQPTAIMIARGDLAVEIGFTRLAEMQEEILWIGEAAQVPVIWATQVLEHLIKKGVPSRGEMTDAAMAARAECVMLNKGPHLFQAIAELETLLARMAEHQYKKSPRLRRLASW